MDTLPTYPAELLLRRQLQEAVTTIRKYSQRYRLAMSGGDQLAVGAPREEGSGSSKSSSDEGIDSSLGE